MENPGNGDESSNIHSARRYFGLANLAGRHDHARRDVENLELGRMNVRPETANGDR